MKRPRNDCDQRSLILPGEQRRLSKAEIAEQGLRILSQLQAQTRTRVDPTQAPRRAVAGVQDRGDAQVVTLVCGHEVALPLPGTHALTYRCLECQKEGRT